MPAKVIVYDEAIVRLIQRGDGHFWIRRKANAIRGTALALAPARTGRLKGSHRVTQNRDAGGRFQTGFIISATAPYARYVHEGTGPWIYPANGKFLRLPGVNRTASRNSFRGPNGNPRPGRTGERSTVVRKVRGQKANPWLERAARFHT